MSRASVTTFGHRGTTSDIRTEISRELVNATDGAGLHLQSGGNIELTNGSAYFGTGDFSIEFVLNQEKENASESYIYVTHTSGHNRLLIFHDVSDDKLVLDFRDDSSASTTKDLAYDMNQDFGTPTHYVITFDRSGLATLYKNGNNVASVNISSASDIYIGTDSSGGRIGTSGTDGVIGTFYRFRTFNKLVDPKALFERADVDYSSQWGSQTNKFASPDTNWGTDAVGATAFNAAYTWTSHLTSTTAVSSNVLTFTTSADSRGLYANYSLTAGKRYRVTMATGAISGATYQLMTRVGSVYTSIGTLAASATNVFDFTAPVGAYSGYLYLYQSGSGSGSIVLTAASVTNELVQTGAVVDMDLAAANPTQSLTVQDRSGAADGTCSASGVSQVQPVVQLNSTSARIGSSSLTPADGELMVDKIDVRNGNVRVIGGNKVQLLNAANDTNADIINSGGTGVAQLGLRVAGSEKVTIASTGAVSIPSAAGSQIALTVKGGNNLVDNILLNLTNQAGDTGTNIRNNGQLFASTLATFSGGITSEKGIMSGSVVVDDDNATTITPARQGGFFDLHTNSDTGATGLYALANRSAKVFFDCASSPSITKVTTAIGADVDVTTADVTGTSGTDGKTTISSQGGVIKIENRSGSQTKYFYTITC